METETTTPAAENVDVVKNGPGRPKSDIPTVSGLTAAIKAHQKGTGPMPEGMTYTPSTVGENHFIVPGKYESREFFAVAESGNVAVVTRVTATGPKFTPEVTEIRRIGLNGKAIKPASPVTAE